jgi:hypothetical protein
MAIDFTHLVNLEWILAELEAVGLAIMDAEPVAALERLEALRRELAETDQAMMAGSGFPTPH